MAVRTREEIWKLHNATPWHSTLLWYAQGVAAMQKRAINDPLSWRFQAAVHGFHPSATPFLPGETKPTSAIQAKYWNQCQHGSWFFLPWHRMYLHHFEKILMAEIAALGGPQDWALPYWNYSNASNPHALELPPEFTAAKLPNGKPNPLRVAQRAWNAVGNVDVFPSDVDLSCLKETNFDGPPVAPGFGGPQTGFAHSGGTSGMLESLPHNNVHGAVGGFMGSFVTAGLDPLFWVHHANIDRLWEVWLLRPPVHNNPTLVKWLQATGATFDFYDSSGTAITMVPKDVLSTSASPLYYVYDDVTDPLAPAVGAGAGPAAAGPGTPVTSAPVPELLGATAAAVPIGAGVSTAQLDLQPPQQAQAGTLAASPVRAFLNLENIQGTGEAVNYAVYLNVPAGADPKDYERHRAGSVSTFGVHESSQTGGHQTGSGRSLVLEVTDVVDRLSIDGNWDPSKLQVTFAPQRAVPASNNMKVGRVSLYFG